MMMMMMMSMSKDLDMDDLGVPPLTLDTPIFLITQGAQNHLAGQVTPGQLQTEAGWMDARAKTARTTQVIWQPVGPGGSQVHEHPQMATSFSDWWLSPTPLKNMT